MKIATFLSSIASDFSPVIIDTNFGLCFLGMYLTKMLHFWNWVQVKSTFQISDFISMIIFWLYSSSNSLMSYCWFSHDVTKIQTKKISILQGFYFHDALEQMKTNVHTNFRFKRVLGFVIEYAWISKLLGDVAFTWRPRELSCRLKKWLISGNFAI